MKWIIALLLLGNLGVFVWQTYERRNAPPPMPAPASEIDSRAHRLPLLSELDPDALQQLSRIPGDSAESSSGAAAPIPPGTRCFTVGPFKTGDTLRPRLTAWLTDRGMTIAERKDERREVALYWVYFPPTKNRQEAVARVEELRSKGVQDVQVVPKGDMANAVSLGVYSKSISRDRRMMEMRQKGYQPEVVERYRLVQADWLDLQIQDETFEIRDVTNQFPGLEMTEKSCSAV